MDIPPATSPSDRFAHAAALESAIRAAEFGGLERRDAEPVHVEGTIDGIYIVFESFPGLELALESLDPRVGRAHPELRAVRDAIVNGERVVRATVFVPDGTLGYFLRRIEQYAETSDLDSVRHRNLLDRIQSIGLASIEELWTDEPDAFPEPDQLVWWEVWLRSRDGEELARLKTFASAVNAPVSRQTLMFADRTVAMIEATAAQLSSALDVLDDLAEVRRPRQPAEVLAGETAVEQAAWVRALADRIEPARPDAPAVCVVDTGVHQPHPLLSASLDPVDCHACDPTWTVMDHEGHGTEMAGLALLGNFGDVMLSEGPVRPLHRLESVKLVPPPPARNPPELYGAVTADAASLVEVQAPHRSRVFSVAVTAQDLAPAAAGSIVVGQPSSWSAAVDALAAGLGIAIGNDGVVFLDEEDVSQRRLFLFSAGNVSVLEDAHLARSDLEPVEDPGQAWNAVTVGAFTEKASMEHASADFDGWTALAPDGELSPFSRTSVAFSRSWPIKPDIVCEGGNAARSPNGFTFDTPDVLSLLTSKAPIHDQRLLTVTRETSAATALAANVAVQICSSYPSLWPETVRALLVHSAEWTAPMRAHFGGAATRSAKVALQRRYGMGVPDATRALRSAADALTLIAQDTIHPFDGEGRMREMHLHDLPWPTEVLAELGSAEVRLRITLSYFIEPNPGRRGWARRYSYASHGLRYEVRRPTESTLEFRQRINQMARQEEERRPSASDATEWVFGPDQRTAGSLHSDIWTGTAADLAERGMIAVFPVTGWWKERKERDGSERGARYALVVSIQTDAENVDIWTPVAQELGIPIEVEI
jgi:hypothetical protein